MYVYIYMFTAKCIQGAFNHLACTWKCIRSVRRENQRLIVSRLTSVIAKKAQRTVDRRPLTSRICCEIA